MSDSVLYNGKLFQVVNRKSKNTVQIDNQDFEIDLDYELIKRPPGLRAIIVKDHSVLLNREFRYEKNDWDYRLPGGKVFDSLEEYKHSLKNNTLTLNIQKKLLEELSEEADILPENYLFFYKSICGFTVEWDLYYYVVDRFKELSSSRNNCIRKNEFEFIEHCWIDYNEAFNFCIQNKISEERSSNALIRFLYPRIKGE